MARGSAASLQLCLVSQSGQQGPPVVAADAAAPFGIPGRFNVQTIAAQSQLALSLARMLPPFMSNAIYCCCQFLALIVHSSSHPASLGRSDVNSAIPRPYQSSPLPTYYQSLGFSMINEHRGSGPGEQRGFVGPSFILLKLYVEHELESLRDFIICVNQKLHHVL
jgi:hypothetical protein